MYRRVNGRFRESWPYPLGRRLFSTRSNKYLIPPSKPARSRAAPHAFLEIMIPSDMYDSTVSGDAPKDYRVIVTVALPRFRLSYKVPDQPTNNIARSAPGICSYGLLQQSTVVLRNADGLVVRAEPHKNLDHFGVELNP